MGGKRMYERADPSTATREHVGKGRVQTRPRPATLTRGWRCTPAPAHLGPGEERLPQPPAEETENAVHINKGSRVRSEASKRSESPPSPGGWEHG